MHASTDNHTHYSGIISHVNFFYMIVVLFTCLKIIVPSLYVRLIYISWAKRLLHILAVWFEGKQPPQVLPPHHFNNLLIGICDAETRKLSQHWDRKSSIFKLCCESALCSVLLHPSASSSVMFAPVYMSWCLHVSGKPIKNFPVARLHLIKVHNVTHFKYIHPSNSPVEGMSWSKVAGPWMRACIWSCSVVWGTL